MVVRDGVAEELASAIGRVQAHFHLKAAVWVLEQAERSGTGLSEFPVVPGEFRQGVYRAYKSEELNLAWPTVNVVIRELPDRIEIVAAMPAAESEDQE